MSVPRTADIVVIGGGITGVATAYNLSRHGLKVALLEKEKLAAGSTGRTVGGVRQQARSKAQLPLLFEAVKLWKTLDKELGTSVGYTQMGNLMLAGSEEVLEFFRTGPDGVDEQSSAGLDTRIVDYDEAQSLAPVLKNSFVGGRYCASDGGANPYLVVNAYSRAAQSRGATVLQGIEAVGFQVEGGQVRAVETSAGNISTRCVVNAAGVWAKRVAAFVGIDLPIVPIRGQVLFSKSMPPIIQPFVFHGDIEGQRVFIRQRPDGHILTGLGNPQQEPGWDTTVDDDFEQNLRRRLQSLAPELADIPTEKVWGGLYEVTPDTEPIIDFCHDPEGLVLACGFSAQGFGPGPAVGFYLAEWIATGERPDVLSPFELARFQKEDFVERRLLTEISGLREDEHNI